EGQSAFPLLSHRRLPRARAKTAEEIVPVPIPPRFEAVATKDNGVRENQSMEALAKLKPYFDQRFGTVTAGNSSQITDGGAAVLLMSASAARSRGYAPLRENRGYAVCAPQPERMGLRPPVAVAPPRQRAGGGGRVEGRRSRRDQRGLRGAGPRMRAGVPVRGVARAVPHGRADRRDRLGEDQRQRGSGRAGAPGRLVREPARHDAPEGNETPRHAHRRRDHVHRRGGGGGGRGGGGEEGGVPPPAPPRAARPGDL